jgi:hypothetical protein
MSKPPGSQIKVQRTMLQQVDALAVQMQSSVREQEREDDGKLCIMRPWCSCRQPRREKVLESSSCACLMSWMDLKPWIVEEEG